MARNVAIGVQDFESLIENDYFYIDKTAFIREWWDNGDSVTLIARPRRFGKTLNMSMLNAFFSNRFENRGDLFEDLEIWEDERYRDLQGTYPVISLSFAGIKGTTYAISVYQICQILQRMYAEVQFLSESPKLSENERKKIIRYAECIEEKDAAMAINEMSYLLMKHFDKKVLILLDEYDSPMQEAYVNGYWEEFTAFIRSLFNFSFKTNPYFERAVMTGITSVSKESIFSDLNNLEVVTTTAEKYETAFGFTEEEVFAAMDEMGLTDKEGVKYWYDGFVFGDTTDIYNPWSIINYLDKKKLTAYWANTSSNSLVGKLVREGGAEIKTLFEDLLEGKAIDVPVDEQIVYNNLDNSEEAIWSLLLATGYLKVLRYQTGEEYTGNRKPIYRLTLTNNEVKNMFYQMVSNWFGNVTERYNHFIKALLSGDMKAMNFYMNHVSSCVFSYFDTGNGPMGAEPEKFYHGFVLGLMVELSEDYQIRSNRESGFGRYDIMIYPKLNSNGKIAGDGIIIEFKVRDESSEKSLEETVQEALKQIKDKQYDAELKALGFEAEHIRKYGFAFEGKRVLIGTDA